jgi:phospholipase D-like protein
VLHGHRAADQYVAEFERLRSGTFGALHERHEPRPKEFRLGRIRIKPLFAPRHGPEMEIIKEMLKATSSVDFAMFTFAQSSGIDDTMIRPVGSLARLRGILDRGQGAQKWAATQSLKAAGVDLFQNRNDTGVRKVHHKLMVIDERLTIVGSFNYTASATTLNDENIIVLGDLAETNPAAETPNDTWLPTHSPRSTGSSQISPNPSDRPSRSSDAQVAAFPPPEVPSPLDADRGPTTTDGLPPRSISTRPLSGRYLLGTTPHSRKQTGWLTYSNPTGITARVPSHGRRVPSSYTPVLS